MACYSGCRFLSVKFDVLNIVYAFLVIDVSRQVLALKLLKVPFYYYIFSYTCVSVYVGII